MRFVLKMNGTTDKLEIPQFQFDKVILDIMVTKKSSWGKYWSSNYSWFQRNSNTVNDEWDTNNIAMIYKNGVPQTNLTPFVNIDERAVFTIEMNKIFDAKSFIFSNMGQVHTGGEIYNVKYYLGDILQAHYDISSGTVKDKSGNGFDGILTGGTWVDNYIAIARLHNDGKLAIKGEIIEKDKEIITPYLEFDGSGNASVPHNNIFNITDAITISARIKITDTSETDYGQFMTKGNGYAWFLGVRRSDGYTVWYSKMNGSNNNWAIHSIPELIDGEWHNIVFSYDKNGGENNQKAYVDGVLRNQKTTTGTFDTTANPLNLVTSSFKGGFRDARIYNRQLTDNEVVDLFYEKSVTEGLIGHWKMNEGIGNIAYDSSSNGNNGSIVGALWKEDIEKNDEISQFRPNGDLIVCGQLVEGTKVSANTGTLARDILVHRYIHQGNKVIQPTGLNKDTGLFTTIEPINLAPGTKRQVITAFNYQFDGSIPREWKGVEGHYIDVVSSTSFYIRGGSASGEILTYPNIDNNLVDVNSFRFEYDFQGNYQVDLSEYNIKKGKFNFKGTRHRPGWSYIYLDVNHSGGNHQHNFGTFADGRDYLTLDVTGSINIEDNFVSARIENYIKTEWNDSNGTWANFQGSNGNVLNQSFDNPSFGVLSFSYAIANGSVVEIYETEMDNSLKISELVEGGV